MLSRIVLLVGVSIGKGRRRPQNLIGRVGQWLAQPAELGLGGGYGDRQQQREGHDRNADPPDERRPPQRGVSQLTVVLQQQMTDLTLKMTSGLCLICV